MFVAALSSRTAVLSTALPFRRGEAAAPLPQRVKILAWGGNIGRTTGARILVDESVAATLCANQELVACDRIPLDYEHQSVAAHPNFKADPRHTAAHGEIEVIPGDGVYLSALDYTPNGAEMASGYQDVSAVVHLDKDGRPLWISSVALTQRGDVAGMEFAESVAALSAGSPFKAGSPSPSPAPSPIPNPQSHMNTTPITPEDAQTFRDLLILKLGLKPGVSGEISTEEIIAAAQKEADEEAAEPVEPDDVTVALSARMDAFERQSLVDAALREGKAIPLSAEALATTSVETLRDLLAHLAPGEVSLSATARKEVPVARIVALSAEQSRAAKALGLTEEEYRKSNPASAR